MVKTLVKKPVLIDIQLSLKLTKFHLLGIISITFISCLSIGLWNQYKEDKRRIKPRKPVPIQHNSVIIDTSE